MKRFSEIFWEMRYWMLSLFALLVPVRVYEIIQIGQSEFLEPGTNWFGLLGFFYDAWFVLLLWFVLAFFLIPVTFISQKFAIKLVPFLAFFFLFVSIGFVEYFLTMNQPVDASIFYFTWDELVRIVGLESRINGWVILSFLLLLALFFGLNFWLKKSVLWKTQRSKRIIFGLLFLAVAAIPFAKYVDVDNALKQGIVNNKLIFFTDESLRFAFASDPLTNQVSPQQFAKLDADFYNNGQIDPVFPTFHSLSAKSDFGTYFQKNSPQQPNIVLIVVESLSSDLVGVRADKTGHLMPFLDSLSRAGLYFPNTLSTAQRTHNVLPATLCSVPNVIDGNVFQQIQYPNHWSLFNTLKEGYRTRFYCGVFLEYINMRGFMNYHQVDAISDHWNSEIQAHSDDVGSPWGYPDGDLFDQAAIDDSIALPNGKSALDVFLTISTHDPFVYPNKAKYTQVVKRKVKRLKNGFIKRDLWKKADKMGAYCYTDDELRKFFQREKQKASFGNTIYLITGDHGTEQCYYDPISKFKVPLVVVSPLLKQPKQIDNVVSHLDLAPTILNFLRLNYNVPISAKVPFIGRELDMRPGFHTDRSLVFTSSQLKTKESFQNGVFLVDNKLFRVNRKLEPTEFNDVGLQQRMKQQIGYYLLFSQYVIHQNHLVPPAYHAQYIGVKHWLKKEQFESVLNQKKGSEKMVLFGQTNLIAGGKMSLRFQIQTQIFCKTKEDVSVLPDVIFATESLKWPDPKKVLYKGVRPTLLEKFKPNARNRVSYTLEFDPRNMDKLKEKKELLLYLWNPEKKTLPFSRLETVISTSKNK